MGYKETGTVKSARRVLEIFEFFAGKGGRATVGEVSSALGYPQSSTSVLMQSLHKLRYLHHDPVSRTYRPTLRFALTGSWIHDAQFTGAGLTELMVEIQKQTDTGVVLSIQSDIFAQYIQVIPSAALMPLNVRLGALRPMCRTAVGKVLLAQKSKSERAALIRRINAQAPESHRVNAAALMAELDEIRRGGQVYSENDAKVGVAQIATLLPPGRWADLPMAIGVSAPVDHVRALRSVIEELLRRVAVTGCRHTGSQLFPPGLGSPGR